MNQMESERCLEKEPATGSTKAESSLDKLQSLSKESKSILGTLCFMIPEDELDDFVPLFVEELYQMESSNN